MGVGFVFAVAVLAISVVSFPLLLDREVGSAPRSRPRYARSRPTPGRWRLWGIIVSAGLVLGSIPLLVGLIVVMPVLGNATWHSTAR